LNDNLSIDEYLENIQALQGWLDRLSIKILTSWFECNEKTLFTKTMQHVRREKSGERG